MTGKEPQTVPAHPLSFLEAVVESIADAIVVLGPGENPVIALIKGAATSLFGAPAKELLGKPLRDIVAQEDRVMPILREISRKGGAQVLEIALQAADGSTTPVQANIAILRSDEAPGLVLALRGALLACSSSRPRPRSLRKRSSAGSARKPSSRRSRRASGMWRGCPRSGSSHLGSCMSSSSP